MSPPPLPPAPPFPAPFRASYFIHTGRSTPAVSFLSMSEILETGKKELGSRLMYSAGGKAEGRLQALIVLLGTAR